MKYDQVFHQFVDVATLLPLNALTIVPPEINATFPLTTHTKILAAYEKYSKNGITETISGDGFVTYPFNQYSKPIVQCAPLHLCIVQLQQGEIVNDIALGDSAHWQVGTALIGTESNGTYQVSVKPTLAEIATDMVITTNLRSYHLGLVSVPHETSHIVSFYYPAETLQEAIGKASRGFTAKNNKEGEENRQSLAPHGIAASQLNFNYRISGHKTAWKPLRAFDDSEKTYIQMPAMSAHTELPVLYIIRNHEKQLVKHAAENHELMPMLVMLSAIIVYYMILKNVPSFIAGLSGIGGFQNVGAATVGMSINAAMQAARMAAPLKTPAVGAIQAGISAATTLGQAITQKMASVIAHTNSPTMPTPANDARFRPQPVNDATFPKPSTPPETPLPTSPPDQNK